MGVVLLFLFSSKKKIGVCHFHIKQTLRTLSFQAKQMWYIALVGNFMEVCLPKLGYISLVTDFVLASTIFRRGVSVSARTSRTLPFDTQKKWAISLSSRI